MYVFAIARSGVARSGKCSGAQVLGAHQHFIQSFKNAKFGPKYAEKCVFF